MLHALSTSSSLISSFWLHLVRSINYGASHCAICGKFHVSVSRNNRLKRCSKVCYKYVCSKMRDLTKKLSNISLSWNFTFRTYSKYITRFSTLSPPPPKNNHKLRSSLVCSPLQPYIISSLFDPNILLSTLFSVERWIHLLTWPGTT
jgi:hypothetical protein